MPERKLAYGILGTLMALSLVMGLVIHYSSRSENLRVVFLDVGQGDAILISRGANQILIDGGKDGKAVLEKLGSHLPFWDRQIEVVVATHPDQDHIGGLVDVFRAYKVNALFKTAAGSDSQTFQAFREAYENEGARILEAERGWRVGFPSGESLEIIFPFGPLAENDKGGNDSSVAAKLSAGGSRFLFTGDISQGVEEKITLAGAGVSADILKVAHHGSKYSTGENFLRAAGPKEAVISVGKKNSYGHPAPEVLERLLKHGIKIYRTDEKGDIVYKCGGEKCAIELK